MYVYTYAHLMLTPSGGEFIQLFIKIQMEAQAYPGDSRKESAVSASMQLFVESTIYWFRKFERKSRALLPLGSIDRLDLLPEAKYGGEF